MEDFALGIGGPIDPVLSRLNARLFQLSQDLTCWPLGDAVIYMQGTNPSSIVQPHSKPHDDDHSAGLSARRTGHIAWMQMVLDKYYKQH